MAMKVFSWLLAKLRNRRFAMTSTNGKALIFGCIYSMRYTNYKRDPSPLILVLYSGHMTFIRKAGHYTDGLNLHYMNYADRMWLARTMYLIKRGNQRMDPRTFYKFLKMHRPNIIRTCYRRYHTSMIGSPRMVSAGWTHLGKLIYPFNDPWIQSLNKALEPQALNQTNVRVAYNQDELRDRINTSLNSQSIHTARATSGTTSATTSGITQKTI